MLTTARLLLEAARRGVPVVPLLVEAHDAWDPAAMRALAADPEVELAVRNPQAGQGRVSRRLLRGIKHNVEPAGGTRAVSRGDCNGA